ncbi:MAG TPA: NfeD family protein [Ferruginibacter sp.]|nr:NfeD family protein [Ferruginibacter sp.]
MVSFWYQTEGNSYIPLVIKESNEIPLFFYVNGNDFLFGGIARDRFYSNDPNAFGNYFEVVKDPSLHFTISGNKKPVKQLFYYGIEKYLSHFINTVLYKSDSIETYRNLFPLRFLFEPDMEEKEKALVEALFTDAGYTNVQRVEYNESLFEVLQEKRIITNKASIIKLTGIDNNLYVELYKDLSEGLVSHTKIEGQGSDPRVSILADMILEYIVLQNPFLSINKEAEIASILPYASGLLHNISPIIKGEATLSDGKPYYFRVNERNLEERLLFLSADSVIYTALDDLVKTYGLDVKTTTILLASEEINTVYFSNKLLKKYPHVKGIGTADDLETTKLIFSRIAASGYAVHAVSPGHPLVIPDRNELKDPPAVAKPGLPPVKTREPEKPAVKLPPALPPKKNNEIINSPPLPSCVNLNMLVGRVGIVISKLSLSGKVEINNKIYEAITEKNEIAAGSKVKVIGTSGKKYVQVEKIALPPLPPKK